jgi:sensor histidine kinase YesM
VGEYLIFTWGRMPINDSQYPKIKANQNSRNIATSGLFKRVAQAALMVSFVSAICLGIFIFTIKIPEDNYFLMLQSLSLSKAHLSTVLFIVGTFLVGTTAITTYFITLYSSFRVAGPLFRFARNLEFGHQHEFPMPHIKVRSYDYFQDECHLMDESINVLLSHYESLQSQVHILTLLLQDAELNKDDITKQINKIKTIKNKLAL